MEPENAERSCGECSLCCTLLRVDALAKLAGVPCIQLRPGGGCGMHATRPDVCRRYRCLWLQGGLEEAERPDHLGAIVDLQSAGEGTKLVIREAVPGTIDRSTGLRAVAERFRRSMPVHVSDADDVLDPDRPLRILWPDGSEHRIRGDRLTVWREGRECERRRAPWLERTARALRVRWQQARLRRRLRRAQPPWSAHAEAARRLSSAQPGDSEDA